MVKPHGLQEKPHARGFLAFPRIQPPEEARRANNVAAYDYKSTIEPLLEQNDV